MTNTEAKAAANTHTKADMKIKTNTTQNKDQGMDDTYVDDCMSGNETLKSRNIAKKQHSQEKCPKSNPKVGLNQPPNSPDMNVLDLGYFNAIQSLQHKAAPQNIDELILAVYESFDALHWSKLKDIFLTLQKVMEVCILHNGRNDYKLPHMSKCKLENLGQLPMSIKVSEALENKINTLQTP